MKLPEEEVKNVAEILMGTNMSIEIAAGKAGLDEEDYQDDTDAAAQKAFANGKDFFRTYLDTFARVSLEYAEQIKGELMPSYVYRYTSETTGLPLRECPACQHNLTVADGIEVEFFDGGRGNWDEHTHLLLDGTLYDPHGHIKHGLHSCTMCGACGSRLMEVAIEDQMTMEPVT
jgi:hypothetical protein